MVGLQYWQIEGFVNHMTFENYRSRLKFICVICSHHQHVHVVPDFLMFSAAKTCIFDFRINRFTRHVYWEFTSADVFTDHVLSVFLFSIRNNPTRLDTPQKY